MDKKYLEFSQKQKLFFKRRKFLLENMTNSEKIFKSKLDKLGIKYYPQKGFLMGECFCIVDFYLKKPCKICIEIDGSVHNNINQIIKDKYKNNYLTTIRKFNLLRITNEYAINIGLEELKNLIFSFCKK